MLDSNEYIFGLSGTKGSCVQLIDQLDTLRVLVPLRVVREVERNLDLMYGWRLLSAGVGICLTGPGVGGAVGFAGSTIASRGDS
jgi:hypothetical protein